MNKHVQKFHDQSVNEAGYTELALASLLLLGAVPKNTPEAIAETRTILKARYVPWLMPCVNTSTAFKNLTEKTKLADAMASGNEIHVLAALSMGVLELLEEVGGFVNLTGCAATSTAKMEKLAVDLGPLLDVFDAVSDIGKGAAPTTEAASDLPPGVDMVQGDNPSAVETMIRRMQEANPDAKVGIITVHGDGRVEGDLEHVPQELKDWITAMLAKDRPAKGAHVN